MTMNQDLTEAGEFGCLASDDEDSVSTFLELDREAEIQVGLLL